MNMMALRYGDDIIVIDAGMMFPESELLGVDLVIPEQHPAQELAVERLVVDDQHGRLVRLGAHGEPPGATGGLTGVRVYRYCHGFRFARPVVVFATKAIDAPSAPPQAATRMRKSGTYGDRMGAAKAGNVPRRISVLLVLARRPALIFVSRSWRRPPRGRSDERAPARRLSGPCRDEQRGRSSTSLSSRRADPV